MKKITFLSFLLLFSLGFSQNLLTNGDFETGDGSNWGGNSTNGTNINVIDDGSGSNFVNQSIITTAGDVWRVGIDQAVALTQNETYTLSFVASADANRTIIAGIGKAGGDFASNTVEQAITTTPTAYTMDLVANFDTVANGSRVLFDLAAFTGTVTLDDISLELVVTTCNNGVQDGDETGVDCGGAICQPCANPPSGPPTVAPPARAAADVKSVYSNAYTAEPTDGAQTFGGAVTSEIDFSGDQIVSVTTPVSGAGLQYQYFGVPFLDLSGMDTMHFDFYFEGSASAAGTVLIVIAQYSDGTNIQENFDVTSLASNTWHQFDVDFSDFDGNPTYARDEIQQVIVQVAGPEGQLVGPFYYDNLYFHNNMVLSTDQFETAEFSVFPNPTNGEWNINSNLEMSKVALFDILGKEVLTITPNAMEATIDASSFKTGVYFARIEGVNGTKTVKLVRQ
ncbi:T9SS type A sorting domain-containing protein [Winogradskyella vincentii]|uniref:T9SS type A sorting domain-containing protein n=1 Tax=Winogradskyella vincentii TaxID=2877122 RepID=A0ABS7Y2I4_9FLAO|nr:T9SS type A sorting domain-containing protein [Winogradskyella vincentii]MCA0154141.1 T9SS type A sorting domain-containing protein [Winogradskyella vincentii]